MGKRDQINNMKKILIGLAVVLTIGSAFSYRSLISGPDEAFRQLGITEKQAQESIWKSFEKSGVFLPPGINTRAAGLKSMLFTSRKQMIQELGAYAKEYVLSEAFAKQYEQYRAAQAPAAPSKPDEGLKRIEDVNRKNLQKAEEKWKNAKTEEEKKFYADEMGYWKKQLRPYEDHNSKEFAAQKKNAEGLHDLFSMAHKNKMREFDEKYPPEVKAMVRQRLEAFLKLSATIDFNAALKKDAYGKKMVFVNDEYERKPYAWKFCFRLGKETVAEARAFVQQWLKELK
jgi:hypothetical protein